MRPRQDTKIPYPDLRRPPVLLRAAALIGGVWGLFVAAAEVTASVHYPALTARWPVPSWLPEQVLRNHPGTTVWQAALVAGTFTGLAALVLFPQRLAKQIITGRR